MKTHEVLFQLRTLSGLNQTQFAEKLDCDRTLIGRYEKNQREQSFPLVQKWIQVTKPQISSPEYYKWLILVSYLMFNGEPSDFELLMSVDAAARQTRKNTILKDSAFMDMIPKHFMAGFIEYLRRQ